MFQPPTWIQLYWAASCRSGLPALNNESTHSEMPKVISEVTSAVQRMAVFHSGFRDRSTSTPSSVKKVTRLSGWSKKFIINLGYKTDYFRSKQPKIATTP